MTCIPWENAIKSCLYCSFSACFGQSNSCVHAATHTLRYREGPATKSTIITIRQPECGKWNGRVRGHGIRYQEHVLLLFMPGAHSDFVSPRCRRHSDQPAQPLIASRSMWKGHFMKTIIMRIKCIEQYSRFHPRVGYLPKRNFAFCCDCSRFSFPFAFRWKSEYKFYDISNFQPSRNSSSQPIDCLIYTWVRVTYENDYTRNGCCLPLLRPLVGIRASVCALCVGTRSRRCCVCVCVRACARLWRSQLQSTDYRYHFSGV